MHSVLCGLQHHGHIFHAKHIPAQTAITNQKTANTCIGFHKSNNVNNAQLPMYVRIMDVYIYIFYVHREKYYDNCNATAKIWLICAHFKPILYFNQRNITCSIFIYSRAIRPFLVFISYAFWLVIIQMQWNRQCYHYSATIWWHIGDGSGGSNTVAANQQFQFISCVMSWNMLTGFVISHTIAFIHARKTRYFSFAPIISIQRTNRFQMKCDLRAKFQSQCLYISSRLISISNFNYSNRWADP